MKTLCKAANSILAKLFPADTRYMKQNKGYGPVE